MKHCKKKKKLVFKLKPIVLLFSVMFFLLFFFFIVGCSCLARQENTTFTRKGTERTRETTRKNKAV